LEASPGRKCAAAIVGDRLKVLAESIIRRRDAMNTIASLLTPSPSPGESHLAS